MKFRLPTALPILAFGEPDQGFSTHRVTSPFALREDGFHGGLDIGNHREGDTLVAVADGTVIACGFLKEPWSTSTTRFATGNYGGLMVVVDHGGVISIYAHMRMRAVSTGDRVQAGDKIGEVGQTGSAIGQAHVHFGMQAPAHRVPPVVKTHPTSLGIGLDIDPWPLITGRVELMEDADLVIPSNFERIRNRVGVVEASPSRRVNLRSAPGSGTDSTVTYTVDGPRPFMAIGRSMRSDGLWYLALCTPDGKPDGKQAEVWVHSALCSRLEPDEESVIDASPEQIKAAVDAAISEVSRRYDAWLANRPK